jgi:hypothetical protein
MNKYKYIDQYNKLVEQISTLSKKVNHYQIVWDSIHQQYTTYPKLPCGV